MKNKLRLFTAVMAVLMMLLSVSVIGYADTSTSAAGSAATLKTVPVSIEGKILQNTAVETGGTLFLPLRVVCEALGYSVEWSREGWSAAVKTPDKNNRSYSDETKLLTNIQYPYFTLADLAAADKINAVILADVEAAEKEAKDNLADYGEYQSPNRSEIYFNYKIAYQQGDVLSVVLWDYQYYGGAHGSTRQITHTFDLKTGAEYTLADLMKADSGYVSYISDTIKQDIVKAGMEDAQLTKFESIAGNQSYYLSDEGLVIYFQQYEYFPYAAGIMEYTIPYADLNQYLKTEL